MKIVLNTCKNSLSTYLLTYLVTYSIFFVPTWLNEEKNHDFEAQKIFLYILTSLQYKPLYNINRSEKWGRNIIQAPAYNGACTVTNCIKSIYCGAGM